MKKFLVFGVLALVGTFAAGAVLAASGSTYARVYSCSQLSNGVAVKVVTSSPLGNLLNGTKNAGSGLRSYTYNCVTGNNGAPVSSSAWYLTRWADVTTTDRVAPTINFASYPTSDAGYNQGYKYYFNTFAIDASSTLSLIEIALRNPDTGVWSVVTSSRAATGSTLRGMPFSGEMGYLQYNKTYQIQAYARDSYGNIGRSQIVTLTVPASVVMSGRLIISATSSPDKIYGPAQTNIVVGKWDLKAVGENINLRSISFQPQRSATGATASYLPSLTLFKLYDGATLLGQSYLDSNGTLYFNNFNLTVSTLANKTLTLKADSSTDYYFENVGQVVAFSVRSDSNINLQAIGMMSGALLTPDSINYAGPEANFAHSSHVLALSAYPIVVPAYFSNSLNIESRAPIFKFNIYNPGRIDLRISTTTVTVKVNGLAGNGTATGTIGNFQLWADNGNGGLGTILASSSYYTSNNGESRISFGQTNDVSGAMDNLLIPAGSSRDFTVTADTANILRGMATGTVSVAGAIDGGTGWNDATTAWSTGNIMYYFIHLLGAENDLPYSWSDFYPVIGFTLTRTI